MIASCSAGSIAGSIRKWVARGIITYDSESKQYNYPHPEPLASMMIKYI
jgi:nicotinamide mononucleotide (NMN) deamidase PncC